MTLSLVFNLGERAGNTLPGIGDGFIQTFVAGIFQAILFVPDVPGRGLQFTDCLLISLCQIGCGYFGSHNRCCLIKKFRRSTAEYLRVDASNRCNPVASKSQSAADCASGL